MNHAKRTAIWEAYFEADYRHRYFLMMKDRIQARIKWLSFAIALLSLGPLSAFFMESKPLAGIMGMIAGGLGVYLGISNLPRSLAVSIQAATAWGQAVNKLRGIWSRHESGEDVWQEYEAVERELTAIDAVVSEHMNTDQKLIDAAWDQSTQALCGAT